MSNDEKGLLYDPPYYLKYPSIQVNEHLNNGGIPAGSIVQIQSATAGSYKTTAAIEILAGAQRQGLTVGYIDAEGAVSENSRPWLENMGLVVEDCYFKGPQTGEEHWETVKRWITEEDIDVVVMDSIHAVQASVLYTKDVGHHHIGNHAMLHKQGLIKAKEYMQKEDGVLIAINHRKTNLTAQGAFGTKSTGGSAWKFYSEFIFEHSKSESKNKLGGEKYIPIDIYIRKSKGGHSYIEIETYAEQGKGISIPAELLKIGMMVGLIEKKGSWYSFEGESVAQGEVSMIQWISENQEYVENAVHQKRG